MATDLTVEEQEVGKQVITMRDAQALNNMAILIICLIRDIVLNYMHLLS